MFNKLLRHTLLHTSLLIINPCNPAFATTPTPQETQLLKAAEQGDLKTVRSLIRTQQKLKLNVKNTDHMTPLHLASYEGHVDIINELIQAGANKNITGPNKRTPLHLAVLADKPKAVDALITHQVNLNAKDGKGNTPFDLAWSCKKTNIAQALVKAGAKIQLPQNKTPMHWAAENGYADLVQTLIQTQPNDAHARAQGGYTPLHLASTAGHLSIVQTLIQTKDTKIINAQDHKGRTPLQLATKGRYEKTIQALAQAGAQVQQKKSKKNTLHWAAENGHASIVQALLQNNDPKIVNLQDENGHTPLHYASLSGHVGIVQILLAANAKPNIENAKHHTPLHYARSSGHDNIATILQQASTNATPQDDKATPLLTPTNTTQQKPTQRDQTPNPNTQKATSQSKGPIIVLLCILGTLLIAWVSTKKKKQTHQPQNTPNPSSQKQRHPTPTSQKTIS